MCRVLTNWRRQLRQRNQHPKEGNMVINNPRNGRIDPLLTIPQVARACRVSQKTVRRWIERRELVAHRLGWQWRISRNDLETFIKIRRQR